MKKIGILFVLSLLGACASNPSGIGSNVTLCCADKAYESFAVSAVDIPAFLGPLMVIGTIDLAVAILLEATLSFLGVGVPPNQPSLGSLIRIGTEYIFSGEWWIVIFPSMTLIIMIISVNIIGDFFRTLLNPRLR